jgi:hypothetical protein
MVLNWLIFRASYPSSYPSEVRFCHPKANEEEGRYVGEGDRGRQRTSARNEFEWAGEPGIRRLTDKSPRGSIRRASAFLRR